jgi:EAL domain-containing protein (putative c-di-GMP-specific phosphodiesterase class I)
VFFDCLREFDARGGWLTFQIREKSARAHLKTVRRLVTGLKKIKCQIALDHFGLMSNPDALLEQLEVDFVKLAPSFVHDVNRNQEKQDTLNTLNAMALKHGAKTVATGVEDANSLTVLWTVGVHYIQGYFLQEPSATIEYGVNQLV